MRRAFVTPVLTLAMASACSVGTLVTAPAATASTGPGNPSGGAGYTFAVIGDVPYGEEDQAHFPEFIAGINADPDVRRVTHLGDIKSGSTTCTNQRFEIIRRDFDLFADPLVYTPGDNEWTDCHRESNGSYRPLERLRKIRSLFFTPPGVTSGAPAQVRSQAHRGVPENVRYQRAGVSFATLHVVGSNNGLAPWDGLGLTEPTRRQVAEERHRMRAAIANVRAAFRVARRHHLRGVVLQQQADMFDPTVPDPAFADYSAFRPLVKVLVQQSRRFRGPVYLLNGDSHVFNEDRPLAAGSRWLDFYRVRRAAGNLHRVTVDGSELGETNWLKVTVQRHDAPLLTFEKIPGA